jgi:hypothetical protein
MAKPTVPKRRGVTRLSTITTPKRAPKLLCKNVLSLVADMSELLGQSTAVSGGQFFRSIPAFAVRVLSFRVRRNPGTPPNIASASCSTISTNRLSMCHLSPICSARLEGRTVLRRRTRPSQIETSLLATATISPFLKRRLRLFNESRTTSLSCAPTLMVADFTGTRTVESALRSFRRLNSCNKLRS